MIMTVDIGGTKTMCTLWESGKLQSCETQPTSSIDDFTLFIQSKIQGKSIESLRFSLAGPVTENRFELTNTGQVLYLDRIRQAVSQIPQVVFLNDLQSLACSLPYLEQDKLSLFLRGNGAENQEAAQKSKAPENGKAPCEAGAKAIVSIGTGLGISAVTKEGVTIPSEGGHVDFAPRNDRQLRLLAYLEERFAHASCERILSGQGIENLYRFVTGCGPIEPSRVTEKAFAGEKEALKAMELFTEILGAACGNFALAFLAEGGVYLGGGIMPKILPLLDARIFEQAFTAKGRFCGWLQTVPVYVILDEMAPCLGLAHWSAQRQTAG